MARLSSDSPFYGAQGAFNKKVVYKCINGKTFQCKYPDMSRVKSSEAQKKSQEVFKKASAWGSAVLKDPQKTAVYKKMKRNNKKFRDTNIYHLAVQDYIKSHTTKTPKARPRRTPEYYQKKFNLGNKELLALRRLFDRGTLTNSEYQQINGVSKSTATRHLQKLVRLDIIYAPAKGVGAVYELAHNRKLIGS